MAAEPTVDVDTNIWNQACELIGPTYREMRFRGTVLYMRSATRRFAAGGQVSTLRVCARQTRDAVFSIIATSHASYALECRTYRPSLPAPGFVNFTGGAELIASSGISLRELERRATQPTPRNVLRVCLELLTPELVQTLVFDAG